MTNRSGKYLKVNEFCDELRISRSTFYDWRAKGIGPNCIRLPNGSLRIESVELEKWLGTRKDVA